MTTRMDRFWAKVDRDDSADGCWLWTGGKNPGGYGQFGVPVPGHSTLAHRIAYEDLIGPIPDGLELDHLCRVRACVRPRHLEPVTHRVNVLRGNAQSARNARKSECKAGHALTGANVVMRQQRWGLVRSCRACHRAAGAAYRERQRLVRSKVAA